MRSTLEMLEKKEKHLESKIQTEILTAKQYAVANKSMALMALKRKRMYEQQREHTRGARFNLETQLMAIENANVNMETLKAMKVGSTTMRNLHGEMTVDKVDSTMDDIREQMDLASEINAAISTPLAMDYGALDEDELAEELEQLEQSELDRAILEVKAPVTATSVSSNIATTSATITSPTAVAGIGENTRIAGTGTRSPASATSIADEDAELAELRASMAL